MNKYYYFGMIVGILISMILIGIVMKAKEKPVYDERQQLARGRAYSMGFYTIVLEVFVAAMLDIFGYPLFMNADGLLLIGFVGILVFVGACIFSDAYMQLNKKPKQTIFSLVCIAIANFIISTIDHNRYGFGIVDGKIKVGSPNLICAILIVLALVMYCIRQATLRREEE